MRILIFVVCIILAFTLWETKEQKVETIIEDGVEVVLNKIEPVKIKGEHPNLILIKEFVIDLERDDLAELGISDITGFDVDSEGNIYLGSYLSYENFIFKFDENGRYVSSFCRKGQGPGEIQGLNNLRINERDEILLTNGERDRLIILNGASRRDLFI